MRQRVNKAQVAEGMANELSVCQMAERYGVCRNRIYQLMKEIRDDLGVPARD